MGFHGAFMTLVCNCVGLPYSFRGALMEGSVKASWPFHEPYMNLSYKPSEEPHHVICMEVRPNKTLLQNQTHLIFAGC